MRKYLVRVYDDIWPEVVYGPFNSEEDDLEHLARYFATILPYSEDDGLFILEIDGEERPTMRAFTHQEIERACELGRMVSQ